MPASRLQNEKVQTPNITDEINRKFAYSRALVG